jgi:hypothetical protein
MKIRVKIDEYSEKRKIMKGYELDKLLFQLKVELGNNTKTLAETESYPKIVALFNAQQQVSVKPEVIVKTAEEELEHIAKRLSTLAGIPKSWEDILDRLYHGYQLPFKFEK